MVEIFQVLDRQEGMLVDRVFVKKILNDMAANLVKLGDDLPQQSNVVHQKQHVVDPFLLAQQLEEQIAHLG